MAIYSKLADSLSNSMNIKRGTDEPEPCFNCRLVYSALSRLAYAALWDEEEMEDSPSITYFKHRISTAFEYFLQIFPEIVPYFNENISELADEIYSQYEFTGQFYHTSFHISPPIFSAASINDITFVRGEALSENVAVSGLGAYLYGNRNTDLTVNKMFRLEEKSAALYWRDIVFTVHWQEAKNVNTDDYEYLNHNLSKGNPYWCNNINKTGICSIMRTKDNENRLYYLYKYENNKIFIHVLSSFVTENGEYRRLANGLFATLKCLPKSTFQVEDEIVKLNIGYLYPPAEMNFIKLYSWPLDFRNTGSLFKRVLSKNVFFVIKEIMENIGYEFTEVK